MADTAKILKIEICRLSYKLGHRPSEFELEVVESLDLFGLQGRLVHLVASP
jgi:hypothetical protein